MANTNPLALNDATRFRPVGRRADSRSPSRSPIRRAQFAAQQLDPLLSSLSPESTLRALKATDTISSQVTAQDVLTQSISEATTTEREIGIRAAFAAQKVREWRTEIASWKWPNKKDRTLGMGFIEPTRDHKTANGGGRWLGSLPEELVYHYEERIEEIRDLLDSLDLDDIKEHVLRSHTPVQSGSQSARRGKFTKPYERMRDFTALITATVIQTLPDLAHLHVLLDAWEIRCSALRLVPSLMADLDSARNGVEAAQSVIVDPEDGPRVTREEFETTKEIIGDTVSSAGEQIDKLLDVLEGHGEALPQSWLDGLEKIELNYAAWVVAAENVIMQNEARTQDDQQHSSRTNLASPHAEGVAELSAGPRTPAFEAPEPLSQQRNVENPVDGTSMNPSLVPKAPVGLSVPGSHKRGPSEVSMAESAMSGYSDISQAEIVDARRTSVLLSPKISMIENPFRASKDELAWFGNTAASGQTLLPPPALQRASSVSMEVPREQVKRVTFQRNPSQEVLSGSAYVPESTPSKALRQLTGEDSFSDANENKGGWLTPQDDADVDEFRPRRRSLEVDPLRTIKREGPAESPISPLLPSHPDRGLTAATTDDQDADNSVSDLVSPLDEEHHPLQQPMGQSNSLEAKIKQILTSLPTRTRFTDDGDIPVATDSSGPSERPRSPTPVLTLSPAKADKSDRRPGGTETGVRVFHLTDSRHSRQPMRLFVRAVGENGDRVMVRVGGGWADLAEYLREYSAHHGRRNIADTPLEVANLPTANNPRDSAIGSSIASLSPLMSRNNTGPLLNQAPGFDLGNHPGPQTHNSAAVPRALSPGLAMIQSIPGRFAASTSAGIPNSYTMQGPSMITTTGAGGQMTMTSEEPEHPTSSAHSHVTAPGERQPSTRSSTFTAPGLSTTTTISNPMASNGRYTPLGAAGPRGNTRRTLENPESKAWVEGMVDKARAASGGSVQVVHGPTTTTTTTVSMSNSTRRATSYASPRQADNTPRQANHTLRQTDNTPRQTDNTLRQSNNTPRPTDNTLRQSNNTPRQGGNISSQASNSPRQSGNTSRRDNSPRQADNTAASTSPNPAATTKANPASSNRSRYSLGDVTGIRRVFLRRKSDNRTQAAPNRAFY